MHVAPGAAATGAGTEQLGIPGGTGRRIKGARAEVRSRGWGRRVRRDDPVVWPHLVFPETVRDTGVPLGDLERLLEASMVEVKRVEQTNDQGFHQ